MRAPDLSTHRYIIPVIVFLVAGAIGVFTSWAAYSSAQQAAQTRFENVANEVLENVRVRLGQHMSLLQATRSFFDAIGGPANGDAFGDFVGGLDIDGQYEGVQGLGFALRLETGQEADAAAVIQRNYGLDRQVWPETDQQSRTPIILLAPQDERNRAAIGYDMFADPTRRAAMRRSLTTGEPQASAPLELVQEITNEKQVGFLVYLPYFRTAETSDEPFISGFVYAPYRLGDLFTAALQGGRRLPVAVQAFDVTGNERRPLYQTPGTFDRLDESEFMAALDLEVAGREWLINVHSTSDFRRGGERDLALVLGAVSLLLATALGMSAYAQLKAAHTARRLQEFSARNLEDREMMLREMKHRIKNSIARILAMSRQTASQSETLEEYNESFSARLQAMSTAQDMLTRSNWQRAYLSELLEAEIEQVMGNNAGEREISGPEVNLDEKAAQGLGLTFHELATNALKYGATNPDGARLTVNWSVSGTGQDRVLELVWQECGAAAKAPEKTGFGTRLIDSSIRMELSGSIERDYGANGLRVTITLPNQHFEVDAPQAGAGAGRRARRSRRHRSG